MKCYVWPATRAAVRRWVLSEGLVKTVYAFLPHTLFSPSTLPSIFRDKPTARTYGSNQKIAAKYTDYKESVLNGLMSTRFGVFTNHSWHIQNCCVMWFLRSIATGVQRFRIRRQKKTGNGIWRLGILTWLLCTQTMRSWYFVPFWVSSEVILVRIWIGFAVQFREYTIMSINTWKRLKYELLKWWNNPGHLRTG